MVIDGVMNAAIEADSNEQYEAERLLIDNYPVKNFALELI
jgi:hypothetical protein